MRKQILLAIAAATVALTASPAFARDKHHGGGHHRGGGHGGVTISVGSGYGGYGNYEYYAPRYAPRAVYYDDRYYDDQRPRYRERSYYDDRRHHRRSRHSHHRNHRRSH